MSIYHDEQLLSNIKEPMRYYYQVYHIPTHELNEPTMHRSSFKLEAKQNITFWKITGSLFYATNLTLLNSTKIYSLQDYSVKPAKSLFYKLSNSTYFHLQKLDRMETTPTAQIKPRPINCTLKQ